jgi:enoyl-[acyl-carrier protein] reductase III
MEPRTDDGRERWAMILGSSSGFGAATAKALASDGYNIIGVHLDLRGTKAAADAVREEIAATGVQVVFHNMNAADEAKRREAIDATKRLFEVRRQAGADPFIAVLLHSLAFGTTLSYVTGEEGVREVSQKQLEMTTDVMAHSLVYWVQDLYHAGLIADGSRIFAMTSEGAQKVVPTYGPVSAAKAALESHVRQLAMELLDAALARNPSGRVTRPEDVAQAIVALSSPRLYWMTGNVIGVDGGELIGERAPR